MEASGVKVLSLSPSSGPLSRPLSLPLLLSLLAHARRCSVFSRQWPRRDGRPMHSRGVWVCVCVCALSVSLVWRWRWSMSLEPSGALALDLPRGIGKCGLGLKTSTCSRCRPALASSGQPLSTRCCRRPVLYEVMGSTISIPAGGLRRAWFTRSFRLPAIPGSCAQSPRAIPGLGDS